METELDLFSDPGNRSPLALPLGYVLDGRYKLGRVLGVGGFGITYAGQTMDRLPVDVAIKEFLPSSVAMRTPGGDGVTALTDDRQDSFEKGLEAFVDEARMLTAFREDPHIVTVIRFFEANGTAYLVMPYYRGRSLSQHLAQNGGTLHVDDAVRLLDPVLDGLGAVHGAGLLHRDVKPDNIYLTDRGNVLLLDFGAARAFVEDETASHTRILSRGYAPPEQYDRSTRHGPWIDVYAAAATLYRCVTGVVPPEGTFRRVRDDLAPASALAPVPAALADVIAKGMHVDHTARYQTAAAFQRAIHDAQGTIVLPPSDWDPEPDPEPETETETEIPPEDSDSPTRWPLVLAGLAALVVVLGTGWALRGGEEEPEGPLETVDDVVGVRDAVYEAVVVAEGPDGSLSLRTLPTTADGARVAVLANGMEVDVLGCEGESEELEGAEGRWCEVRVPQREVWMVKQDLQLGTEGGVRIVSVVEARAYASRDTSQWVFSLAENRAVTERECDSLARRIGGRYGSWCRVSAGPYEGWAFGAFLRVLGDSTDAGLRQRVVADLPNPTPFRLPPESVNPIQPLGPDVISPAVREAEVLDDPEPEPASRIQALEVRKPRVTASTTTVVLDYVGRLADGTEFDRGVGVPLELSNLLVGLREGLVGMEARESRRIVVPPLKGYGVRGLPQRGIPGGATLTFDVTVREIR